LGESKKSEEELRRLSVELQLLEQTAETLQSRVSMVNASLTDLTYASMTLEGLEKEDENAELLVPIGGSSYIKARLAQRDKVIVGMGAGVSVEKTLEEAKAILRTRMEELEKARVSAQQQLEQVVDRINADRQRMEQLVASLREGKASTDV
jgi:prefoldin alpha subunit